MSRRLVLLVAVSALGLGLAVPTHAAGRPSGCLTVADPQGDAHAPSAALYQPPATPGVDISSVKVSSSAQRLVAQINVGDITKQPVSSTSTRYALDFVLSRWAFRVFYRLNAVPSPVGEQLEATQGIEVFDELVSTRVKASVAGNTVTLSVDAAELERIRGKAVVGQPLTQLAATTTTFYAPTSQIGFYPHQQYDTAEAPRSATPVLGASC